MTWNRATVDITNESLKQNKKRATWKKFEWHKQNWNSESCFFCSCCYLKLYHSTHTPNSPLSLSLSLSFIHSHAPDILCIPEKESKKTFPNNYIKLQCNYTIIAHFSCSPVANRYIQYEPHKVSFVIRIYSIFPMKIFPDNLWVHSYSQRVFVQMIPLRFIFLGCFFFSYFLFLTVS